ncbi:alkaline phosphatase family protein [Fluviicola chungangensis]|uniref:Sulfatase-like hydrolase/transferase n=1 Tax=Fluviicola chungangensis TaxID=2597671 RepID=A0A556N0J2_9FLAO|nr:alkaline phosphatase family protein [Fluviicola chungangensis]TSJ45714.1 sulfatase-like hydrolase/transferase [Fluviicola chungangensis]
MIFRFFSVLFVFLILLACTHDKVSPYRKYQTQNVIIIAIDGPRYSETWGDPLRINIPVRDSLSAYGALFTNFRNLGETFTIPGHTAICTGNYQSIANDGSQLPNYPSIFQMWLKSTNETYTKCGIIGSKDKLRVLSNCLYPDYQDQYRPFFNCGVNGDGTGGYRADSVTLEIALNVLAANQPKLMLIAFKDPDFFGHQGDSARYIDAIRKTDEYLGIIWNYIQNSPVYKDKTTLIITNDHGRHLDGISDGYKSHGDNCDGCRHIELFALSPDFKSNVQLNTPYDQLDISATIGELLHFPFYTGKGKVMTELFR